MGDGGGFGPVDDPEPRGHRAARRPGRQPPSGCGSVRSCSAPPTATPRCSRTGPRRSTTSAAAACCSASAPAGRRTSTSSTASSSGRPAPASPASTSTARSSPACCASEDHRVGDHFAVRDAISEPKPVQERLPLLIGGKGDRMLGLVARHADEWNMWSLPETQAERAAVLARRCEAIGRDPGRDPPLDPGAGDAHRRRGARRAVRGRRRRPRPPSAGTVEQFAEVVAGGATPASTRSSSPTSCSAAGAQKLDAYDALARRVADLRRLTSAATIDGAARGRTRMVVATSTCSDVSPPRRNGPRGPELLARTGDDGHESSNACAPTDSKHPKRCGKVPPDRRVAAATDGARWGGPRHRRRPADGEVTASTGPSIAREQGGQFMRRVVPVVMGLLLAAALLPLLPAGPAGATAGPPDNVAPTPGQVVPANPVFRWEAGEGAVRYVFRISLEEDLSPVISGGSITTVNTSLTFTTELPTNVTLYWGVTAYDTPSGTLGGAPGPTWSFKKGSIAAPTGLVPSNLPNNPKVFRIREKHPCSLAPRGWRQELRTHHRRRRELHQCAASQEDGQHLVHAQRPDDHRQALLLEGASDCD